MENTDQMKELVAAYRALDDMYKKQIGETHIAQKELYIKMNVISDLTAQNGKLLEEKNALQQKIDELSAPILT